jgi:DNA-binding FadR family transcriptional regulator
MKPVPQRKLRRKRLSEELTAQLRKHIIDHGLKPGDPLLTEQEMVERFGVSRSVVREATKALDFLGIIDAVPRRGMILDDFDFSRVSEYFGFHFALSDYPREKLLKARAVIETGALYYVMEAMKTDPAVYQKLRALAEAAPHTEHAADERWIEYDIAFHHGLVEATDITPLASFYDLLQAFFQKFRTTMGVFRGDCEAHCMIVDALHLGKLETAIDTLRTHMKCYEDSWMLSETQKAAAEKMENETQKTSN